MHTLCSVCSAHFGVFSAFGETHEHIIGCSVHQGILVNTMSTLGEGSISYSISVGYFEYILGVQCIKVFNINFKRLLSISSLHVSCQMYLIHPAVLT